MFDKKCVPLHSVNIKSKSYTYLYLYGTVTRKIQELSCATEVH